MGRQRGLRLGVVSVVLFVCACDLSSSSEERPRERELPDWAKEVPAEKSEMSEAEACAEEVEQFALLKSSRCWREEITVLNVNATEPLLSHPALRQYFDEPGSDGMANVHWEFPAHESSVRGKMVDRARIQPLVIGKEGLAVHGLTITYDPDTVGRSEYRSALLATLLTDHELKLTHGAFYYRAESTGRRTALIRSAARAGGPTPETALASYLALYGAYTSPPSLRPDLDLRGASPEKQARVFEEIRQLTAGFSESGNSSTFNSLRQLGIGSKRQHLFGDVYFLSANGDAVKATSDVKRAAAMVGARP